MTQPHKPEDVETLIEVLKDARDYVSSESCMERIDTALAKFAPKPEKAYVLPEWEHRTENQTIWCIIANVSHDAWIQLRYFTATEAHAQKWKMPTWNELPIEERGPYDSEWNFGPLIKIGRTSFNSIRNKIMEMNNE